MIVQAREGSRSRGPARAATIADSAALAAPDEMLDGPAPNGPRTASASELGALPLRTMALPAPVRDVPAIRRRIAAEAGHTYMDDLLLDDDSLLVRWPDRTVTALRVWVQPSSSSARWDAANPQVVRDAFAEWSAAGFPLRFLHVLDSAGADVHVTFTESLPEQQLGVTRRFRDAHGWLVGATIVIGLASSTGAPHSPAVVAAIARHEVGHTLGLGHTADRSAIMYPTSNTLTIGARDRATLRLLYALPPGSLR